MLLHLGTQIISELSGKSEESNQPSGASKTPGMGEVQIDIK